MADTTRLWSSATPRESLRAAPQAVAAMRIERPRRSVAEVGRQEERWRLKLSDSMEPGPT